MTNSGKSMTALNTLVNHYQGSENIKVSRLPIMPIVKLGDQEQIYKGR